MREIPILYLVVPCYNEEEVVEKTAAVMGEKLTRLEREDKIAKGSKVMFVNDGSKDKTLQLLHGIAGKDRRFSVVSLAGNYGHQSAILAGMMTARKYADVWLPSTRIYSRILRRWMLFCNVIWRAAR